MINKLLEISKNYISLSKNLKKDFEFRDISKYTEKNYVLIGMRRLGKTEYLKFRVINSGLSDEQILYINFDASFLSEIDFSSRSEKFAEFIKAMNEIIKERKIKLVLLDEIQRVNDWARLLKGFVDENPEIRFAATGSDAVDLMNSSETGVGRFNIIYVGPILYREAKKVYPNISLEEYINYYAFPQGRDLSFEERYQAIIEKQVMSSKLKKINVDAILRAVSSNPGIKMTKNKLATIANVETDSKIDSKQAMTIIEFLIASNLIISIRDIKSNVKASNETLFTLYPYDWSMFSLYQYGRQYENLESKINGDDEIKKLPTKGFVFENMIISNVYSSLRTSLAKNQIFNKISEPDIDFILKDVPYEIKSFDVLNSPIEVKVKIKDKALITRATIIHMGETKTENDVQYLNWEEFLLSL